MKKTLLLLIFPMLFSASYVNAQIKVWDFGNDTTNWPIDGTGIVSGTSPIQKDLLGLVPHTTSGTNFGIVAASNYTFTADGFVSTKTFKTGGGGSPTGFMPTVRYFYFNVSGACTVKVWARTGSAGVRNLFLTDGTNQIATVGATASGASGDPFILTGTVTSAQATAGKIYLYGDGSWSVFKIEVTGATVNTPALATNNFQQEASVSVFSNGKQVNVANVVSETQVNVYSMTGALVKSFSTSSDMNFDLNSGFYIVNVKSAEGQKSVKVLVK